MRNAHAIDISIACDKKEKYRDLETIFAALVSGCIFGKVCLQPTKEIRRTMYSPIALTDTYLLSFHKNDILRMVDNRKRRVLNDQMTFLKQIPSPEFALLSKKKLQNICDALKVVSVNKGAVVFHQDDPIDQIYIVKEGVFSNQVRLSLLGKQKTQGLEPGAMLKESEETSGKLAQKSKTVSTKPGIRRFKMHQVATLGTGSVIGCEDVLVLKSKTHVSQLTCLSMRGELYTIEKDFFFAKLSSQSGFIRKFENQCLKTVQE